MRSLVGRAEHSWRFWNSSQIIRLVPDKESKELVEKIYTELEKEILDINFSEIIVTIFGQEVTLIVNFCWH